MTNLHQEYTFFKYHVKNTLRIKKSDSFFDLKCTKIQANYLKNTKEYI